MNNKEIVSLEEGRRMALASAMIQTYPKTLEKKTETLFLNIFWTRLHAEFPEATSEEIEWARKQLNHLREPGVLERIDRIADITFAELSALEDD